MTYTDCNQLNICVYIYVSFYVGTCSYCSLFVAILRVPHKTSHSTSIYHEHR